LRRTEAFAAAAISAGVRFCLVRSDARSRSFEWPASSTDLLSDARDDGKRAKLIANRE
jgi:hypothetical protein